MKILIVAQNASSRFGGEAFLPLKYFQLLKKRREHEVRLIVHSRNRKDLTALFPNESDSIHYIEDSALHRFIWRIGNWFPKTIGESVFGFMLNFTDEWFQRRLIKRMLKEGGADVIHQPIPVSPKAPSSIFGFGVPVIIGPMNGGMTFPDGYEDYESKRTRYFVFIARRLAVALNWLIPGKRLAAVLLVANSRTRHALPQRHHPCVIEVVENAVDRSVWRAEPQAVSRPPNRAFHLAFVGRFVRWKAINITLDAIRLAREDGHEVHFSLIGDGEEKEALVRHAERLNLSAIVNFKGFMPQAACAEELKAADALILNSIYECGGAVVLEGMSLGLPIIAADWGGPADYVDNTCGILVSPIPRATYTRRLADAIGSLAANPALRAELGTAGLVRVQNEFDWEKKIDRILEIYAQAISNFNTQANRPLT